MGKSAFRPRSMIDCPPTLMTLVSGIIATTSWSNPFRPVDVSADSPSAFSMTWRAPGGLAMRRLLLDDGPGALARQRARELPALQAVHDLDPLDVPRRLPHLEELAVENQLLGHVGLERVERDVLDELRVGVLLGVLVVEPVLVLHEDHAAHPQHLGQDEEAEVRP